MKLYSMYVQRHVLMYSMTWGICAKKHSSSHPNVHCTAVYKFTKNKYTELDIIYYILTIQFRKIEYYTYSISLYYINSSGGFEKV